MFHVEFQHTESGNTFFIPCSCTMIKLVHHKDNLLYRCRISNNPKDDKFFKVGYFEIGRIWVTDDLLHTPGRWIYDRD